MGKQASAYTKWGCGVNWFYFKIQLFILCISLNPEGFSQSAVVYVITISHQAEMEKCPFSELG